MTTFQKYARLYFGLLSLIFVLSSCSGSKKALSTDNLLQGSWKLTEAILDGTKVDAEMLGGEILFEFSKAGNVVYTLPGDAPKSNRYVVEGDKIKNPDDLEEAPIEIVSLSADKLVLRLFENGQPIVMNLVRR